MGITFYPSDTKAETFTKPPYHLSAKSTAHSTFQANVQSVYGSKSKIGPANLFQSSLPMHGDVDNSLVPIPNGLLNVVLEAYNRHRMLVIRPDDVWITILTQFNYFVNANAEELRESFVAHEGKKELRIDLPDMSMDVEYFAKEMILLLEENITDPAIREWIMPDFTTTTAIDKTVGAVVMMSTFQKYFEYIGGVDCGLPAVTLEGEKKDWQSILRRVEKLKEYGLHTTTWYHLLRPILRRFVKAFDDPSSDENLKFWRQIVHEHEMSGGCWTTGWINGFSVFDGDGKWTGPRFKDEEAAKKAFSEEDPELDTSAFWNKFMQTQMYGSRQWPDGELELDGAAYGNLYLDDRSPGCVGVPIKLIDGLAPQEDCGLIAGIGALAVSSSGDRVHSINGESDTVKPVMAWWLYTKDPVSLERQQQQVKEMPGGGKKKSKNWIERLLKIKSVP